MRIALHDYAGHPFQFELSRALARRGHEVRHFFFADDPGPKGSGTISKSDPSGFSIEPLRIHFPYSKNNFALRFVGDHFYGHQAARRIGLFHPDVVISGNAPLDVQQALRRATRRAGCRFVFWAQDFYGFAIERILSGRWSGIGTVIAKWYRRMEDILLCESDKIVLISPGFVKYLPPSLADSPSVHIVRNWGALELISPRPRANPWRERMGLANKFVFMYTGTLGLKHDPRLLLALSDAFANDDNVAVVVVANGVNADYLKAQTLVLFRKNLILQPLQSAADFPDVLGTADVVVALLESDAAEFSVPSKLLSYLCAGRPILLSAPPQNLAAVVLAESGGGLAVSPLDLDAFIDGARLLAQDSAQRDAFSRAGRSYAEKHFGIEEIAGQFERILESALSPSKGQAAIPVMS
jgi:colanic acid biosynthesis glycosyl transferase WcaI